MTKSERIAELERQVAELRARVRALEALHRMSPLIPDPEPGRTESTTWTRPYPSDWVVTLQC